MERPDSIRMNIEGLTLDPATKTPIVVLRDGEGKFSLPIWIGLLEATSIATELESVETDRPMTHDILRSCVDELGARVAAVEVSDLRDNTFYATIFLERAGTEVSIDARPSDAIALALRAGCPIFVAKKVLEQSSVLQTSGESARDENLSDRSPEQRSEILERMTPDDFKYKM